MKVVCAVCGEEGDINNIVSSVTVCLECIRDVDTVVTLREQGLKVPVIAKLMGKKNRQISKILRRKVLI